MMMMRYSTSLRDGGCGAHVLQQGRTERELTDSYTPIVKQAIHECDVTRHYQKLAHVAEKTPFLKDYAVDIERYTITKALAGLFHVLADQERVSCFRS